MVNPRVADMNPFIERHKDSNTGVLSCFDRVVFTRHFAGYLLRQGHGRFSPLSQDQDQDF